MDRFCTSFVRHFNYFVYVQVTLSSRRRAYWKCFICVLCKKGILVYFGIYCNCFYVKLSACAHDANGYFTAVGNEYFFEHILPYPTIISTSPALTVFPSFTKSSFTAPP